MRDVSLVLAFDADCGRCRAVATTVARTCPPLEVLPLGDYRVREWREEVYAGAAPHVPTLIAITHAEDGDVVRAWHGPRLVPALVARIGPLRAAALARTLVSAGVLRRP